MSDPLNPPIAVDDDPWAGMSPTETHTCVCGAKYSRPATDPAGLDVERLAEAVAFARGRSYIDMLDTLTAQKIKAVYEAGMAEPGARLSVADGPGPEERPLPRAVDRFGLGVHDPVAAATAGFLFDLGYPFDFTARDSDGEPSYPPVVVMDALVDEWIAFDAKNHEPRDETVAEYRDLLASEIGADPWERAALPVEETGRS